MEESLAPSAGGERWTRYRHTLDSLLEGFQIIGRDWTYLYVNPAAARHGRRTPEELHGRRVAEVYPGIEATPLFVRLQRCMRERVAASFETLFTFPDAVSRWFEVRVEPVPEGICIHSVDIQARKDAEMMLREQESIAALGRMAAIVAHEVKNPLAGLSGTLQVLRGRRQPQDPEIALFDQMLRSIHSLDRLVEDLLQFAKPMQLRRERVPIAGVVRDVIATFEGDDTVRRHRVTASVDGPEPVVDADRETLKQVFRNLILNAAQAMTDPGVIDVRITGQAGLCHVTVSDTGPGVPPTLVDRIFEPFVSGRRGGTGLGLPISRRIVRLHGGELELVPAPVPGATFQMTLALQTAG